MSPFGGISKALGVVALLAVGAIAANWGKLDGNGVVVNAIVADASEIAARQDGPWVELSTSAGIGFSFDGENFIPPDAIEISSVTYSTPTASGQ